MFLKEKLLQDGELILKDVVKSHNWTLTTVHQVVRDMGRLYDNVVYEKGKGKVFLDRNKSSIQQEIKVPKKKKIRDDIKRLKQLHNIS